MPDQSETVRLRLPSGEIVKAVVPRGMSESQIRDLMRQKHPEFFPSDRGLLQKASELGTSMVSTPLSFEKGILKGAGSTAAGVSSLLNKIPGIGETLAPSEGVKAFKEITTPRGTAEKAGHTVEQIGEFFLPAGVEEKGAALGAKLLPKVGRIAGRVATEAATTGAVEKLHGGEATTGAIAGGIGGAAAEILPKIAPSLATTAMRIIRRDLKFGAKPGEAVLEHTSAIRPATIARETRVVQRGLTERLEAATERETKKGIAADIQGTLNEIDDQIKKTVSEHDVDTFRKLLRLKKQTVTDIATKQPVLKYTPTDILNIKRGIGKSIGNWSKDNPAVWQSIRQRVYGALDKELDRVVPEAAKLNQEIHSLLVAETATKKLSSKGIAGTPFKLTPWEMYRLFLLAGGYAYGYKEGGTNRAIEYLGGVLGLTSPTGEMMTARLFRAPAERLIKAAVLEAIQSLNPTEPNALSERESTPPGKR